VPDAEATMPDPLRAIIGSPICDIRVIGHTDRVGTVQDNDLLARERARFVRKMLMDRGLQERVIQAVGRDQREPRSRPPTS
jgi:outer membrane protein OmpA-like peptidoglycan-associated protein